MPSARTTFGTPASVAVPSKFKASAAKKELKPKVSECEGKTKLECDCKDPEFAKKHPELCKTVAPGGPGSGGRMRPVAPSKPEPSTPVVPPRQLYDDEDTEEHETDREDRINDIDSEIEDIKENPDGDPDESSIEDTVDMKQKKIND